VSPQREGRATARDRSQWTHPSIVFFDDVPDEWAIDPFMTCVVQDAYGMDGQGAELLLTRLTTTGPAKPRAIVLPMQLSSAVSVVGLGDIGGVPT
jgi:DNA-binding LacI/PurR family transcriptional regulator